MTNRMTAYHQLLQKMRHAKPSWKLDREIHILLGGRFALVPPCYTSNFEAAYHISCAKQT